MSLEPELQVEKIDSREQLLALEPEWTRLDEAQPQRVPFTSFEWAASWWAHFAEARLAVKDRLFVRALRTPDGALAAVAPLMLTERPSVGPARLRMLQFFGADPYVTELRGMICAPGQEAACHRALLDHLRGCGDEWDWLRWGTLRDDSPARSVLDGAPQLEWRQEVPMYILPLPPSWGAFKAGLKRNIKESMRKCYNSLAREGHSYSFEAIGDPAGVPKAIELFFQLHRARANLGGTTQHSDVFSAPSSRRFLREVSARLARRGRTRVFILRVNGAPAAARVGFALGDTLYLYFSGFDPRWAKYSVMTTTVIEALKYAIGQGFARVNLSTGSDVSKTRWGPEEVLFREALQVGATRRAQLARAAYELALATSEQPAVRRLARGLLGRRSPSLLEAVRG